MLVDTDDDERQRSLELSPTTFVCLFDSVYVSVNAIAAVYRHRSKECADLTQRVSSLQTGVSSLVLRLDQTRVVRLETRYSLECLGCRQIYVRTDEGTQVHSARPTLVVSYNPSRSILTGVDVP